MRRARVLLCLLLLALPWRLAHAADALPWLYTVDVPVPAQAAGASVLRDAARAGLMEVLVRVSGNRSLAEPAARRTGPLAAAWREPARYYTSYAFVRDADPTRRTLRFQFGPTSIQQLLQEAGQPQWPNRRPRVLVWAGSQDADGRSLLDDPAHPLLAGLRQTARRRGLDLVLPAMDLQDSLALAPEDLWFDNWPAVLAAGERYNPDLVLVARLRAGGLGEQVLDWRTLGRDSIQLQAAFDGVDPLALGSQAMDLLADRLAARFAVLEVGAAQPHWVEVTGVETLADYAAVQAWLTGADSAARVEVVRVLDNQLLVRLHTAAELVRLQRVLALDGRASLELTRRAGIEVLAVQWQAATP